MTILSNSEGRELLKRIGSGRGTTIDLKIAQSTIFFGLILTLFTYFLSFYLMPFSNKQLRISKHNIQNNYTNLSFFDINQKSSLLFPSPLSK